MARGGVEPRRFSRARLAAFRAVEFICKIAGGRAFYRIVYLRPPRLRVRRERVAVAGLPAAAANLKIAHLSDFHGGSFLRGGDLGEVVKLTNALEPDVIALTGDFVTHRTEEALDLAPALGGLRARLGVFAVFGNHDYRGRREGEIERALANVGIQTLRNRNVMIMPGVAVAGIEDLEEGKVPDFDAALAGLPANTTVILLSHHPEGLRLAAERNIPIVLSGHTHGTQIQWPVLRDLGPRHPGDRVEYEKSTLLVSHGIGVIGAPLRIGSPAEVLLVTLLGGGN